MNIAKIRFNIQFAYEKLKHLDEYVDLKARLVMDSGEEMLEAMETKDEAGVKQAKDALYKRYLAGRGVSDGIRTADETLPPRAVEILKATKFITGDAGIKVSLGISGIFTVVQKGPRSAVSVMENVKLEQGASTFKIRDYMHMYDGEPFSLAAVKSEQGKDLASGFALIGVDSLDGIKGKGALLASYLDAEGYYIDVASKYIDTRSIMRG